MGRIDGERDFRKAASAAQGMQGEDETMEKRMSGSVEPGESLNYMQVAAVSGGLALYWCCLLTSLTSLLSTSDSAAGTAPWWIALACHVGFFASFACLSCFMAHLPHGAMGHRVARTSRGLVIFAALALAAFGAALALGAVAPAGIELAISAFGGVATACLLFGWIPLLAALNRNTLIASMSISAVLGSVIALNLKLLAGGAAYLFLAACMAACLGAYELVGRSGIEPHAERAGKAAGADRGGIPLDESRRNAQLSWSFGAINIIYGVVFGVGAGNLLQAGRAASVALGSTIVFALGAVAAHLFAQRSQGRIQQSTVLRMLFPVLVIALVPLSFLDANGGLFVACNLLVLGCCAFLVLVSIAFEIKGANERGAAAMYFVGMSQTTLAGGIALGFALDVLPGLTGAFSPNVLSAVALGLVIALAVMVTLTQNRMVDSQAETDAAIAKAKAIAEQAKQGRWKVRCAEVAANAKLSARETEVFYLLAKGRGTEHIQNKLGISSHTVKTHTYNIYKKLGVKNREELLDLVEKSE